MGSNFYGTLLPDLSDLDNTTGNAPGYRVYIMEEDGGITLSMVHADANPNTEQGPAVFLNVSEAHELVEGLQAAITRAEPKNANHRNRGIVC
jgi:hypothetical protein